MRVELFLYVILIMTFAMVGAKRITALVNGFRLQSLAIALHTLVLAVRERSAELYAIAVLLFLLKVVLIPLFLRRVARGIRVNEDLGLFVNPAASILVSLLLVWCAHLFTGRIVSMRGAAESGTFTVALSLMLIGMFIMMARMKALAQIVGLLVMENGLFLAGAGVAGGMPFFVEIAIFFDIFLCVIILGVFVYRIRKVFTHIDIDKLTELRG